MATTDTALAVAAAEALQLCAAVHHLRQQYRLSTPLLYHALAWRPSGQLLVDTHNNLGVTLDMLVGPVAPHT